jgi:hypothetical protein
MAQETRVVPIEFSNTPTQVLMSIAEQGQQEALKKQQLEFEKAKYARAAQEDEMKRRYENAQQFNTAIQNPDWTKETRDMYLAGLLKNYANARDVESFDYRVNLGKQLGQISQYNNMVKGIYSKADDYIKSLPESAKQGFTPEVFKNKFIQTALTKDGRPKSLEELQKDYSDNLIDEVYQQNKSSLYDVATGHKQLTELIKSVESSDISVAQRDKKGNVISGQSIKVKFNPELQMYDDKTGEVKLKSDEFGYITDDVYKKFTSFPAVDASYTRKAEQFINDYNASPKEAKLAIMGQAKFVDKNNDGIPDMLTAQDLDLVKKGFMTQSIKSELPDIRANVISRSESVGEKPKKNDTTDFITRVENEVQGGSPESLADLLYEMRAGNGKFEVTNVKVNKSNKGFTVEYNTGSFDEDGNPIIAKRDFNPFDKNFTVDLANFYQRATGSDAKLEKSILTGKRKDVSQPAKTKLSIKRSDIPAKAKSAGYTTAEYEALLKEKGVTII